ncbi:MAG: hypothetical protein RLY78_3129 [Pseudomonadota bacterium]|jgi:diguanylate cyclase (GGDEF)-like protein
MPDTLMSGSLPRILVVDDDAVMLRTLAGVLAGHYDVALARSAEQALPLIAGHPPDLLLLDLQMPGLGGVGLCRLLKSDPVLHDLPVVFLTAHADEATELAGLQAGAADFIAKPPSAPVMLARLGNLVRLRRLSERLQAEARFDGLTGLRNRAQFDRLLRTEWLRAQREGRPLSLLLADIDHFKAYNDHCGHPAGDHALREVAQVLRRAGRRPADQACRYGGEEFALLLPLTDAAGARHVGHALLQALRQRALAHPASSVGPWMTLSIGLATVQPLGLPALPAGSAPELPAGADPAAVAADSAASGGLLPDAVERGALALVEAADRALYAAKQAGRAQVWRVGLDGQPERIDALPPSAAPSAAPAPAASANPAPPAPSDRAGVADAAA